MTVNKAHTNSEVAKASLVHAIAALSIALVIAAVVALTLASLIEPKISAMSRLKENRQRVDLLVRALDEQQGALEENLQLIGAPIDATDEMLSSENTQVALAADIENLTNALEAIGFARNSETAPRETPVTPLLSLYKVSLQFIGDQQAAGRLLSEPLNLNTNVASFSLIRDDAAGPDSALRLSFELQRIGAPPVNDASGEGN